ncbi:MAG: hypothetical protein AAF669_03325 [Pseudomonadota bacterium]
MKYLVYLIVLVMLAVFIFFAWTWRYPYHLGYSGEIAVGYYRFKVVKYDITDYRHKDNVAVFEDTGKTSDYIQYLLCLKKPNDIGITRR